MFKNTGKIFVPVNATQINNIDRKLAYLAALVARETVGIFRRLVDDHVTLENHLGFEVAVTDVTNETGWIAGILIALDNSVIDFHVPFQVRLLREGLGAVITHPGRVISGAAIPVDFVILCKCYTLQQNLGCINIQRLVQQKFKRSITYPIPG